MAKNQIQLLKKLTTPATSSEAKNNLNELSNMLEASQDEFTSLTDKKEDILSTFDDRKIDDYFEKERKLDKQIQMLEVSNKRLTQKLEELRIQESKATAKPIRNKGIKAQKRGVEIYKEYEEHARAIQSLLEELEEIEKTIHISNDQCDGLDDAHETINTPYYVVVGPEVWGVNILDKSENYGMRLPFLNDRTQFYVNKAVSKNYHY